jgi:putative peptidoglycan lipid II flippase
MRWAGHRNSRRRRRHKGPSDLMTRHDATPARAGKAVPGVLAAAGLIAVVTLVARVFGFGRWLVFSQSVGATCVGNVYQAANQLPNVVFEVAAGGALAAVVVPIIAGQLARQDDAKAARTASAMLTWTLALLVPLSLLLAVCARPLSTLLVDDDSCAGSTDLTASMLVVFAPQIALYGVGIVLAGVLQAHRRFLGVVVAPLLSSLVVIATYLLFGALARGKGDDLSGLPAQASTALAVGTTLGVAALSLPLLVPVHRAGIRLRPAWTFPQGVARRASVLAGAGLVALVAQQVAVLVTLWVSQHRGGTGALNVYMYVQAVYLLPYAVLAVPVAMSAMPALATGLDQATLVNGLDQASLATGLDQVTPATRADQRSLARAEATLAASARAIIVATSAGAAVLFAIAVPTGAFFSALDAGRHSSAGQEALAALPAALSAFAPGLVGFGMAALLTRALYVQGRPAVAGGLVAAGWSVAAIAPLLMLRDDAGPRNTLIVLGLASSVGMTLAAVGLFVAVRGAWGAPAFRGFGRSAAVALAAGVISAVLGRALAAALDPAGLVAGAVIAVLVAVFVVTLCAVSIWFGDRDSARLVLARLPGRSHEEKAPTDGTGRLTR